MDDYEGRSEQLEVMADEMEAKAKLPPLQTRDMTKRLMDAPGWCLKVARQMRQRSHKFRKAYQHKQGQRNRKAWKRNGTYS